MISEYINRLEKKLLERRLKKIDKNINLKPEPEDLLKLTLDKIDINARLKNLNKKLNEKANEKNS